MLLSFQEAFDVRIELLIGVKGTRALKSAIRLIAAKSNCKPKKVCLLLLMSCLSSLSWVSKGCKVL